MRANRRTMLGVVFVVLPIVAVGVFYRETVALREVQLVVAVTNQGKPLQLINLGEARWSGASYEIYSEHDHSVPIKSADAGDAVLLTPGNYDVKITYGNGDQSHDRWALHVAVKANSTRTFELDVPAEQIGPQKIGNTWKP